MRPLRRLPGTGHGPDQRRRFDGLGLAVFEDTLYAIRQAKATSTTAHQTVVIRYLAGIGPDDPCDEGVSGEQIDHDIQTYYGKYIPYKETALVFLEDGSLFVTVANKSDGTWYSDLWRVTQDDGGDWSWERWNASSQDKIPRYFGSLLALPGTSYLLVGSKNGGLFCFDRDDHTYLATWLDGEQGGVTQDPWLLNAAKSVHALACDSRGSVLYVGTSGSQGRIGTVLRLNGPFEGVPSDEDWAVLANGMAERMTRISSLVVDDRACRGLSCADYDNDGRLDLFVAGTGGISLYLNYSDGRYGTKLLDLATEPAMAVLPLDFDLDNITDYLVLPHGDGVSAKLYRVYETDTGMAYVEQAVQLGLEVTGTNGVGIGALVQVDVADSYYLKRVDGGGMCGGQSSLVLYFGDFGESGYTTKVAWPDGYAQTVTLYPDSIVTVRDDSAPQFVTGSFHVGLAAEPGDLVVWSIEWDTQYGSDPSLEQFTVSDNPRSPSSCWQGTHTYTPGMPHVTSTITPLPGGGYHHKMIWSDQPCGVGCSYRITASSGTWDENGTVRRSDTEQQTISLSVCLPNIQQ